MCNSKMRYESQAMKTQNNITSCDLSTIGGIIELGEVFIDTKTDKQISWN